LPWQLSYFYKNCQQLGNTYLDKIHKHTYTDTHTTKENNTHTDAKLGYTHTIYIYISPFYISERSCETYANCISVPAQKQTRLKTRSSSNNDNNNNNSNSNTNVAAATTSAAVFKSMQC